MKMCPRKIGKRLALQAMAGSGVFTLCRWWTRRQIRIFAYHGVSEQADAPGNFDGFFVAPPVFEAHLRTLAGHYRVLPLSQIVTALIEETPLPERAAAITFDDGYANNAEVAALLLHQAGLPATFFVTTGFIDGTHRPWWADVRAWAQSAGWSDLDVVEHENRLKQCSAIDRGRHMAELRPAESVSESASAELWRMMTWDQVRSLAAAGFEIGAHTVSHASMGHEDAAVMEREMVDSRERIMTELGAVSPVFAYPYGQPEHLPAEWINALRQAGYLGAVTTVDGFNTRQQDPFFLYRLNVTGNHDRYAFRALAAGCTAPRVPVRRPSK